MWSRRVERKPPRIKPPSSSRNRLQVARPKQQPNAADSVQNAETTKAVAWAVFQHNGGGDGRANPGHLHSYSPVGVRRPTRFKIEAQMKQEITHRSAMKEVVAVRWEAGSTLFDSFELDSLLKTLDEATHPGDRPKEAGAAGAVVVYSPKQEISKARFLHEHVGGATKPAFKSPKEASHSTLWKSFVHSLHLDSGLFQGLNKLQSQVAPHDAKPLKARTSPKSPKSPKSPGTNPQRHVPSTQIDVAQFDALFGGYEFPVSKDGRHFWKLSFKAPFTKDQAWAAAFAAATTTTTTTTLHETSPGVSHHHHHHHHHQHHQHHHDLGKDYELTVQAISRRVARASFDEKVRRASMEFESGGMEAPRNSLDCEYKERVALYSKPRSVWDSY